MPNGYDPFDPEEIRRRQMLGIDVMSPDEEDEESSSLSGSVSPAMTATSTPSTLTASQQHYRSLLDQMPQARDYQPSRGRRIGAAIAGGLAGLKDAKTGYSIGHEIASQPYEAAMTGWQNKVGAESLNIGLDKDIAAQDIARRRAGAYEQSAQARVDSARATEAWRKYQEAHTPWQPTTEEESAAQDRRRHGSTARPSNIELERQWMMDDPKGFERYNQLKHAPKRTIDEEKELIDYHAKMTAKYRRPLQPRVSAPATPQAQAQAEHLAAQQLIREDPKYAPFYQQTNGKVPARFKTMDELPKSGGILGGIFNSVTQEQESLARDMYRDFQSKVAQRAKTILGSKSPGRADDWDIQEEDDEQ